MAKIIEKVPDNRGKKEGYPWDEWTDGQSRELVFGEDFHVNPYTFRNYVYDVARRKGMKVKASMEGDSVFIQFYN